MKHSLVILTRDAQGPSGISRFWWIRNPSESRMRIAESGNKIRIQIDS